MLGRAGKIDSTAFQAGRAHARREADLEKRLKAEGKIGPIRLFELGARSAPPPVRAPLAAMPKLRRALMAGMILAGALPAAAFIAPQQTDMVIGAIYRSLPTPDKVRDVVTNAACAKFVAVQNQDETVGYIPAKNDCIDRHFRTVPPSATAAHEQALADAAIEGDIAGPGTVLSISLPGLARAVYYKATGRARIGGTSPLQSAIEATAGSPGGLGLLEKLRFTFWVAPSFTANHLASVEDREVWTTAMLTCAKGMPFTGGGFTPVAGDLCGYVVGADTLEGLQPAQRCVIAALRKHPLAMPGPDAGIDALREYQTAWQNAKRRADDKCLGRLLEGSYLDEQRALLATLRAPDPAVFRNLESSLHRMFPNAAGYLGERMRAGAGERGQVATSILPAAQVDLARLITERIGGLAGRISPELCIPGSGGCADALMLDVAVLVAELLDDGQLVTRAIYQSRAGLLVQDASVRSMASTTKAMMVPLLLSHGIDRLCRAATPDLRDFGGPAGGSCSDQDNWMSIETALARSSNLAFFWGLRQIPDDAFIAWLDAFGFDIKPGASLTELRRGVIIGNLATITPDRLIRGFAAITSGQAVRGPDSVASLDLGEIYSGNVLARATAVLSAPAQSGGTASALEPLLAEAGCDFITAKTGTADTNDGVARDRLLIAGTVCSGRRFFSFTLVGAPRVNLKLGRTVHGSDIVQLGARALALTVQATSE